MERAPADGAAYQRDDFMRRMPRSSCLAQKR
jgi:hypothetical protein